MNEAATDLFSHAAAQQARLDSMKAAETHADPKWVERAFAAVNKLARTRLAFTTDDVWMALGDDAPPEPRALGAVMRRAERAKVVQKTQEWVQSSRAISHGRPVLVWKPVP